MFLSTSPLIIHLASKPLSIPPAMLLSIHPFIHLHIYPFMRQTTHLSAYIIVHSFILSPTHSSLIHLGVYTPHIPTPTPSSHPFAHLSLCIPINLLPIYFQIYLFIHQFICPSILLSLYSFFKHRLRTCNSHTLEGWKFVLGDTKIKNSFPTLKST